MILGLRWHKIVYLKLKSCYLFVFFVDWEQRVKMPLSCVMSLMCPNRDTDCSCRAIKQNQEYKPYNKLCSNLNYSDIIQLSIVFNLFDKISMGGLSCIPSDSFPINKQSPNQQLDQTTVIKVFSSKCFVQGKLNFNKQSTFKKLEIAARQLCIGKLLFYQDSHVPLSNSTLIMKLLAFQHNNVLQAFSLLQIDKREPFLKRINEIDLNLMDSLYDLLILKDSRKMLIKQLSKVQLSPFNGLPEATIKVQDKMNLTNHGLNLLRQGKVVILFLCSGPSSRFYFQDKFLHPIEIFGQQMTVLKLLFQRLKKNLRIKQNNPVINLTIIVSCNQSNQEFVEKYLSQNIFFGFDREDFYFIVIPSLPILSQNGKICLNFQYNYLNWPKGSACCLEQILDPFAFEILTGKNIQYIHVVGTENIAESPGDPLFIGLTDMLKRKVSIKSTSVLNPNENFPRLIFKNSNQIRVLDVSDLEQLQKPCLFESEIALNSMIFAVDHLKQLFNKFKTDQSLVGLRAYPIKKSIYNFLLSRPMVDQSCWAFYQDIKEIILYTNKPLVLKVDRKQFIPIVTSKLQYSIKDAVQLYMEYQSSKLSQHKDQ